MFFSDIYECFGWVGGGGLKLSLSLRQSANRLVCPQHDFDQVTFSTG